VAVLAILAVSPATSKASPLDFQSDSPVEILLAQRAIADSSSQPTAVATEPISEPDAEPPADKSIAKAVLLDLAVPGTGHLYAGKKRGWVYLGLEAVAWVAYVHYNDLGRQKETEFENYADAHWTFQDWYVKDPGAQGSPEDSLLLYFHENNSQQYYEDIGKISTYFPGWDSYPTLETKDVYTGLRAESNNFLQNANSAIAGAFLNRIISSVDVFISMKKHGASLDANTKLRFKVHTKPFSRDNAVGFELVRRI